MNDADQLIRHATLGGLDVAWSAIGSGPPLVVGGWWSSQLELDWQDAAFRGVLAHGGAVLVADERVADEFAVPASAVERLNYAASVLHCMPATMAESTAVANGTVLRAPTLRAWAEAAGFAGVVDLPVEHELWRFYRLGGDRPRPTLAS